MQIPMPTHGVTVKYPFFNSVIVLLKLILSSED